MMSPPRRSARPIAVWLSTSMILSIAGCARNPPPPPPPVNTAGHRCPLWWNFPRGDNDNGDSPYLGCVSAANLHAMLANPSDLARGRPLGPADASREALAIETYQQGKVKPLQGGGSTGSGSTGGGSSGGQ